MSNSGGLTIKSCRDIEALYSGERMPRLSVEDVQSIANFLDANNCVNVGGGLTFDPYPSTHEVKSMAGRYCESSVCSTRTFYGPYLMAGKYYPNGIGVWTKEIG